MGKFMSLVLLGLFGFGASADIHCRFDPNGAPSSYVRINVKRKAAFTLTGWPVKRTNYREVFVQETQGGFNVTVFGDVLFLKAKYTNAATLWFDQNEVTYPFEAYWNPKVPGGPTRQALRGVCWTDKLQKTERNLYRTGG